MIKIRKGTSIIEIVIATTLISIAIIAALSLTSRSQKQNSYARDLAQATKYATQAVDWIRSERDRHGYDTIYTISEGPYCLNILPSDFLVMEPGICNDNTHIPDTLFQREINLTKTAEAMNIVVSVSWFDTDVRQAKIEMELTSWH